MGYSCRDLPPNGGGEHPGTEGITGVAVQQRNCVINLVYSCMYATNILTENVSFLFKTFRHLERLRLGKKHYNRVVVPSFCPTQRVTRMRIRFSAKRKKSGKNVVLRTHAIRMHFQLFLSTPTFSRDISMESQSRLLFSTIESSFSAPRSDMNSRKVGRNDPYAASLLLVLATDSHFLLFYHLFLDKDRKVSVLTARELVLG